MHEISDADNELLELARASMKPETRMDALRVFKKASPGVVLTEVDAEERLSSAIAPLKEENKRLREDLETRTTAALLEKKRDAIRARGLDVDAVEKVMLEKGITNHESAAEFVALNSRPAVPTTSRSWDRSAKVPANEGLKDNPAAWARQEAAKVIDELRTASK